MRTHDKTFFATLLFVIAIIAVYVAFFNDHNSYDAVLGYCVIVINILGMIKVRHNWYLLFIFLCITYSNYSICAANYISHLYSYFTGYAGTEIGSQGIRILLLFSVLLLIVAPATYPVDIKYSRMEQKSLISNNRYNPFIVIGMIILLAFIWVFGFGRPDVVGQRGSPSAIYEYSIILLIISFYYSGKDKKLIAATVLTCIAFSMQNFVFGGRITGVQILIMVVLALFIDRLKVRRAIPVGILFFVIMSGIGQLRGAILISGFNIRSIISRLANSKLALDTAYSAYYTSLTFLDELTNTTLSTRWYLFTRWVLSMFLGGSVTDSNLSIYTRQTHVHYFGGVLPFFAWFYMGLIGIAFLMFYLRFLFITIARVSDNSSGLVRCVTLYITCTCLRWYLYSPSQLFRGVMLMCLVYGLCYAADSIIQKKPIRLRLRR